MLAAETQRDPWDWVLIGAALLAAATGVYGVVAAAIALKRTRTEIVVERIALRTLSPTDDRVQCMVRIAVTSPSAWRCEGCEPTFDAIDERGKRTRIKDVRGGRSVFPASGSGYTDFSVEWVLPPIEAERVRVTLRIKLARHRMFRHREVVVPAEPISVQIKRQPT